MVTPPASANLGRLGESYAARWLSAKKGLGIVARNVHAQGGEIDIIAYDAKAKLYVLVEVKTRTDESFAAGLEAVGPAKQAKMQRAAAHFFLVKRGLKEVPEFEIHALILVPQPKRLPWQAPFSVEYFEDLS